MHVLQEYKDFIRLKLSALEAYDAQRPVGHVYEFHLHSERVAKSMRDLAVIMGYDDIMAEALYWATLPHDIGKISLPIDIWDRDGKPSESIKSIRREHTLYGVQIFHEEFGQEKCANDPFLALLVDIMNNHHEHCNGTGYHGKTANDLSQEVRMACICDAFDGYSVYRPHYGDRDTSPQAVIERMDIEKSGQFDHKILQLFKEIKSCQSKPSSSQPSPLS